LLETLFPLVSNDDVGRITMGRIGDAVVVDDGKLARLLFEIKQTSPNSMDRRCL